MENLLSFGVGIATCLIIIVSVYGIITIRNVNNTIEELEDDLDNTNESLNKFKRDIENRIDDANFKRDNEIKSLKTKLDEALVEIEADFEDIENDLDTFYKLKE